MPWLPFAKTLRAWPLPITGAVTSALAHPTATYAASAVLHVVLLGGIAYWLPGDSDPTFWMGSGDGGIGNQATHMGSTGGAPLTTVFHFELPPAPLVQQIPTPPDAEESDQLVVAAAIPRALEPLAPTSVDMISRRDVDRPDVQVDAPKLESHEPKPEVVAAEVDRAEKAEEERPELTERLEPHLPRREVAAAPLVEQTPSPAAAENSDQPVVAVANPLNIEPLALTMIERITRRDVDEPIVPVDAARLETREPKPEVVAADVEKAEKAAEEKPEATERQNPRLPRREVAKAPPNEGEVRVEVPEIIEANGRGVEGAGSGGGRGDGNGGARGLAGGDLESLPRKGPRNPAPVYPLEARAARMEGRVFIRVQISAEGTVEKAQLERSSGWPLLDDAALKAVNVWRFDPARRGGFPVACEVLLPVHFTIAAASNR